MHTWHIITGEYPPQRGGVSDYTYLLANGLRAAGDDVEVWAPACAASAPNERREDGAVVHRLPGCFGPAALSQLDHALRQRDKSARLLVQYVPHMYGFKAMNVPFCAWLAACARRDPWVMFHEVAFPLARGQRFAHNVLGAVNRLMAGLVARAAGRVFVSIPQWEGSLKALAAIRRPVIWLPIPSTMPIHVPADVAGEVRQQLGVDGGDSLIGHFSTYTESIAVVLDATLPILLRRSAGRTSLLLGRGSDAFAACLLQRHADLAGRVHARSDLPPAEVASHLAACDALVQPYPDGVSSRRTSVMAGLALGKAIVTTHGPATESVWLGQELVIAVDNPTDLQDRLELLIADPALRAALGARARAGYERNFSLNHTIDTLRALA